MNKAGRQKIISICGSLALAIILGLFVVSCEKPRTEVKEKAVKTYQSDDFLSMVSDKSRKDVETMIGKPYKVESRGETQFHYYNVKLVDRNGKAFAPKVQFTKDEAVAISLMPYEKRKGTQ